MPTASSSTVIHALTVTIAVGVLVWLASLLPTPALFQTIVRVVATCALVLWLLRTFGLLAF